jgi:hypothetical protein
MSLSILEAAVASETADTGAASAAIDGTRICAPQL